VVATSEAAAADGVDAVDVDYEPLPAVLDLEAAMDPASPPARTRERVQEESDVGAAHADVASAEARPPAEALSDNVIGRQRLRSGAAAAALDASDAVVAGRFETPWT